MNSCVSISRQNILPPKKLLSRFSRIIRMTRSYGMKVFTVSRDLHIYIPSRCSCGQPLDNGSCSRGTVVINGSCSRGTVVGLTFCEQFCHRVTVKQSSTVSH